MTHPSSASPPPSPADSDLLLVERKIGDDEITGLAGGHIDGDLRQSQTDHHHYRANYHRWQQAMDEADTPPFDQRRDHHAFDQHQRERQAEDQQAVADEQLQIDKHAASQFVIWIVKRSQTCIQ